MIYLRVGREPNFELNTDLAIKMNVLLFMETTMTAIIIIMFQKKKKHKYESNNKTYVVTICVNRCAYNRQQKKRQLEGKRSSTYSLRVSN